ncbi:unnamed protein product [Pedinophyceae sp. YPF-701]|nr:unnamed protein product [Pedinophyceae sp. YPF-701]
MDRVNRHVRHKFKGRFAVDLSLCFLEFDRGDLEKYRQFLQSEYELGNRRSTSTTSPLADFSQLVRDRRCREVCRAKVRRPDDIERRLDDLVVSTNVACAADDLPVLVDDVVKHEIEKLKSNHLECVQDWSPNIADMYSRDPGPDKCGVPPYHGMRGSGFNESLHHRLNSAFKASHHNSMILTHAKVLTNLVLWGIEVHGRHTEAKPLLTTDLTTVHDVNFLESCIYGEVPFPSAPCADPNVPRGKHGFGSNWEVLSAVKASDNRDVVEDGLTSFQVLCQQEATAIMEDVEQGTARHTAMSLSVSHVTDPEPSMEHSGVGFYDPAYRPVRNKFKQDMSEAARAYQDQTGPVDGTTCVAGRLKCPVLGCTTDHAGSKRPRSPCTPSNNDGGAAAKRRAGPPLRTSLRIKGKPQPKALVGRPKKNAPEKTGLGSKKAQEARAGHSMSRRTMFPSADSWLRDIMAGGAGMPPGSSRFKALAKMPYVWRQFYDPRTDDKTKYLEAALARRCLQKHRGDVVKALQEYNGSVLLAWEKGDGGGGLMLKFLGDLTKFKKKWLNKTARSDGENRAQQLLEDLERRLGMSALRGEESKSLPGRGIGDAIGPHEALVHPTGVPLDALWYHGVMQDDIVAAITKAPQVMVKKGNNCMWCKQPKRGVDHTACLSDMALGHEDIINKTGNARETAIKALKLRIVQCMRRVQGAREQQQAAAERLERHPTANPSAHARDLAGGPPEVCVKQEM